MNQALSQRQNRRWTGALFVVALLSMGAFDDSCHSLEPDSCVCPELYAPVCGADGKTYSSTCHARCVSVPVVHEGKCEADCQRPNCPEGCEVSATPDPNGCHSCLCPMNNDALVCMSDVECGDHSRCDIENFCESPPGCDENVVCPAVCYGRCVPVDVKDADSALGSGDENSDGSDTSESDSNGDPGASGGNGAGDGSGQGGPGAEQGPRPDCICTREYAPVCGVDGKTYGNACSARCAGVAIDHRGECRAR